jgi:Ca2+-binding RTX toxin-like protein
MSESLVGGAYSSLTPATQQLLDRILGDTVGGSAVTSTLPGGGTLITATGSGGVLQGAVISSTGQAVTGEIVSGDLTLAIALPGGVNLTFEGPGTALTAEQANAHITGIVDAAYPANSTDPAVQAARYSLVAAIDAITQSLTGGSTPGTVTVRVVTLTDSNTTSNARPYLTDGSAYSSQAAAAPNEVVFTAQNKAGTKELLTFMTEQLGTNKTLVLKEVQNALIIGAGTVRVDGATAAFLNADSNSQVITGGAGNDTLVGGGGRDTITGGSGKDVFGVNALGHLTITDFNVGQDKLAFSVPGFTKATDLAPYFTGLTVDASGAAKLNFGDYLSITLVGVSPEQLTLDLLQFKF